jgi:hypothetical protein
VRVLPPVEKGIRRIAREERAKDPLITVSGLEHVLEAHFSTFPRSPTNFTRENYRMMHDNENYLLATAGEHRGPTKLQAALQQGRNRSRQKRRHDGPRPPTGRARQRYLQEARRPAPKEFQYEQLPSDVRAVIVAAWTRGGLLPPAMIDEIVPLK